MTPIISIRNSILIPILFCCFTAYSHLFATPACQIVTENFSTLTDGTTSDSRSTGWTIDASQIPNALYFAIKSHRFQAEELGGQGIWYSKVMTVTGKPNFQVGVKITAEGSLTSSEYVRIYYKLNGGTETLLDQRTGNFGTIDFQSGLLNANTVQIVVKLYNYDKATSAKSVYYIEEYRLFSNLTGCSLGVSPSVSGTITCASPTVTLSPGTNTTSNVTYLWSGPNSFTSTAQNPVISTPGTYSVTATIAASSATATGSVIVAQNTTLPGANTSASGTLECSAPSVVITASSATSGVAYSWSGPDDFTSTRAIDTIHIAGTYTVTVTNPVNGCSSTSSVTIAQGTQAPGASASVSGPLTCSTTSVILSGSSSATGVTYSWSGPGGFTSTLQNPVVSAAGVYTLTVRDLATNCTSTATVTVVQSGALPGATASVSGAINCTTNSVTLLGNSGTSGVSYSWSGPNSFTSTAQNPVVSTTGTYTLTVTNSSTGCQSIASTTVTQNTTAPGATASAGGTLNCTNTSVTLSGSSSTSGVTYNWSGPNSFTSASQNPLVTTPGTYTLTVTNPANGCTSTANTIVSQSETLPGASAGVNGTLTCSVTSVTLTGSSPTSGVTYSWSGPNSFASTAQNPSVSTAGTYTLTVTNPLNNCNSIATAVVNANNAAPGATASVSGTLTCNTSVTLLGSSGTSGVSYNWSGPGTFTSTAQNPSVSTAGTYTLTVTNPANGCASTSSVSVASSTATASDFWVENFTFSNGTTVDNGTTSWSIQNPGSGTFSVQSNEFMASFSAANEGVWLSGVIDISTRSNVVLSAYLRSATASSSDYFESDDYIRVYYKLNGGAETLVFGDAAGLNGADNSSSSINITSSAINGTTLQIVIRARNSSTTERYYFDNVKLNGIPITTGINASASVNGTLTCTNTSVTLQGSSTTSGVTYSWTGPNSFTSSLQNPTATVPGAYVLTVSNSAGCTASSIVNVTQNITTPGATAGVSGTITCTTPSVTITGSSSTSGVTYSWSGPNSYTSTAQNNTVNIAGTYILTVTNPANGCTSSQSVLVNSTAGTTSTLWLEDFALTNGTIVDNGTTSWSITAPSGTFSVNSNEFRASGNGTTTEGLWTSGSINIAGKSNVTISADLRSSGVVMNTTGTYLDYIRVYYKLNGGSEILISEKLGSINNHSTTNTTVSLGSLSGTSIQIVIRARASGSDEFYYFDNIKVTATSSLTATAAATGVLGCTINSISLSGTSNVSGGTYSWSGPGGFTSTLQNPAVSNAGIYTLTVTDPSSGCIATDTAKVVQNLTAPGATASVSGSLTCTNASVPLSGSSSTAGVTYNWSGPNGFTAASQNPSVTNSGAYTLTVTNPVNGCASSTSVNVIRDTIAPDASVTANGTLTCTVTSVTLSGSSTTSGVTYSWAGPNGFSTTSQNPAVSVGGTYTLTVTNLANGCFATRTVLVNSNTGATGTIWNEDFPHSNGTIVDNGITSWSVSSSAGTFSVNNNEFLTTNTETSSQGVWTSDVINISGKTNVSISADVRSAITGSAVMNTSGTYMDYIRFYYKLNGGSEILFAEKLGAINSHSLFGTTVSKGALSGSTVQIIVKARATGSDEFYYFDNVKVIGSGQIDASASVSGSLTCTDVNVTLLGNSTVPGVTYNWSGPGGFTSSSQYPSVSVPGTYSLTVTDPSNGCYSVVSTNVAQNITPPGASAGVSGQLSCTNALVTLSGNSSTSGVTYNWSGPGGFTSTLQNPSVNTLGTYTVTVTNPLNECTSVASVDVTAAAPTPANTFWLEDFTYANGTIVDNGATSWSLQNTGTGTFSVQSNEMMASFSSANEGAWLSGVVDISAKSNVVISVDLKSGTASSSDYLESDDYIRVFYKLDNGPEILMYEDYAGLGSTTNSTATATVTSGNLNAGTLQVVIRARNSHSTERYYFDNIKLTGSDQTVGTISASVSGPITCPNPTVQLTASVPNTAATYYWIRPDNTIINQQNITVNEPGNYNVVVSVGGCQASKTVIVTGSTQIPNISISGDHLACSSSVPAILNAVSTNSNLSYAWSGPGGFTSNIKSPSVLNAGTYTVTVTDQTNLCTNSASFGVQFGTLLWNEEFEGLADGTIEDLGSTAWSVNNSQIHTVDLSDYSGESGIPYYFEVRSNKLTAKSTRGEVVWTSYPINISGASNVFARMDVIGEGTLNDSTNCGKDCFDYDYVKVFYKINGGAETPFSNLGSIPGKLALSNLKVSSNIPSGNTLQIVIRAYNTGNSEIFYFDNVQVLALGQGGGAVTASASGPITCNTSSVTLTASPNIVGNSYNWTGPNGFTSSDPVTTVDRPGTYTLIVVGSTGCVSSDTVSVDVIENRVSPVISVNSSGVLTCATAQVTVSANTGTTGVTYNWSGPGGFTSAIRTPSVTIPGNYIVTVTNPANGCSAKDSILVTQDIAIPSISIAPVSALTCSNTSVNLDASTTTANTTFTWTGFTSGMDPVTVTLPGKYVVTAKNNTNGCTKKDSIIVAQDIVKPNLTIAPVGVITVLNPTVTLSASSTTPNTTITWTGFTAGQNSVAVSTPGKYYVTATNNTNGCIRKDSVTVTQETTPPDLVIGPVGTLTCTVTSVTLNASSSTPNTTITWTGFAAGQNPVMVSTPGKYIVTATNNTTGAIKKDSVTVSQNTTQPNVTIGPVGILTCSTPALPLTASSSTANTTLTWSGFSAGQNPVSVVAAGKYIVTATNQTNGCIKKDSVMVSQNVELPGASASVNEILTCDITSVTLSGTSPTAGVQFEWTGPDNYHSTEQNPSTNIPGSYTVTAINPANGCRSSASVTVVQDTLKPGGVTATVSDKLTCSVTAVILTGTSTTSDVSFDWSGPNGFVFTGEHPLVTHPGTYVLTVQNPVNGCTSAATVNVLLDTVPPADVAATVSNLINCRHSSVTLTGTSGTGTVAYQWAGPGVSATTQSIEVTVTGTYFLTVTNTANGCIRTATAVVRQDFTVPANVTLPTPGPITCSNPNVTVSATSTTQGVEYKWSGPNGFTSVLQSPVVGVAGTYFVTVTYPVSECSVERSVEVIQNISAPASVTATASGNLTCDVGFISLTGTSSPSTGVSYSWIGPEGFSSALQIPLVNKAGKYLLTVTLNSTGCTAKDSVTVVKDTIPPANVTAEVTDTLDCNTATVILIGSSSNPDAMYSWAGPGGFSSPDAITFTNLAGDYTVTATDPINGCSGTATVTVLLDDAAPLCDILEPASAPAALSSNVITAVQVSDVSYLWHITSANTNWSILSGGDSRELTYQAGDAGTTGTIVLTVTNNGNGCLSECQVDLTTVSTLKSASMLLSDTSDNTLDIKVLVYPNPFRDMANIEFSTEQDTHVTMEIHSMNGSSRWTIFEDDVLAYQYYKVLVDGSKMAAGTYYFVIKTNSSVYSGKLLLIK
jgi:hypothetical protein